MCMRKASISCKRAAEQYGWKLENGLEKVYKNVKKQTKTSVNKLNKQIKVENAKKN